MKYAMGTQLVHSGYSFSQTVAARALCVDGKVRKTCWMGSPDTVFSIPAAVRVRGRYVSGYVTVETMSGSSVPTDDDPAVVKFFAVNYRRNIHLLSNTYADCMREIDLASLRHDPVAWSQS